MLSPGSCIARARTYAMQAGAGPMPSAAAVPRKNKIPPSVAKARPLSHCVSPPSAAYAAHAEGEARIISTPTELSVDAAGRNKRGELPVTLSAGGNKMREEARTVELAVEFAVHGRVTFGMLATAGFAMHEPAFAAVVFGPQHLHAGQPGTTSAEEEQQQDKQRLVPQSMFDPQVSPG